jgi:plasmid maintenance system antidote protein VapI
LGRDGEVRASKTSRSIRGVSADTALRLQRYFGSDAQGWMNLQTAYDLRVAEKVNAKTISKEISPLATTA